MTTARPAGRSAVMEAILDAAADLFAVDGPAATSIRQVATRSGVNHGLVYRHFGTKEELVSAVLDHVSNRFNEAVASGPELAGEAVDRQWRVLARAILDGYPVGRLQRHFPFVRQLVEKARLSTQDETSARLTAGHVVALELGWRLFEPFLRSATGLEELDPDTLRQNTWELSRRVLGAPAPIGG